MIWRVLLIWFTTSLVLTPLFGWWLSTRGGGVKESPISLPPPPPLS